MKTPASFHGKSLCYQTDMSGTDPVRRAPFVKKQVKMDFTSGMLTSVQLVNPSEVLEFIQIPIAVAKAIVSIPSAMLQFKTTQITADNNLLTAQQKNLESANADYSDATKIARAQVEQNKAN